MLLTFRSTVLFSCWIVASVESPARLGPVAAVPPAPRPAPVVTPALEPDPPEPEDCAVPRLLVPLVPGAPGCDSAAPLLAPFVPMPLAPMPVLAALAPPAVPAAAPAALPLVVVPDTAPPPAPPPDAAPPALAPPPAPPPPPPPPCANTAVAVVRPAITIKVPNENLAIGCSPFPLSTRPRRPRSGTRLDPTGLMG